MKVDPDELYLLQERAAIISTESGPIIPIEEAEKLAIEQLYPGLALQGIETIQQWSEIGIL